MPPTRLNASQLIVNTNVGAGTAGGRESPQWAVRCTNLAEYFPCHIAQPIRFKAGTNSVGIRAPNPAADEHHGGNSQSADSITQEYRRTALPVLEIETVDLKRGRWQSPLWRRWTVALIGQHQTKKAASKVSQKLHQHLPNRRSNENLLAIFVYRIFLLCTHFWRMGVHERFCGCQEPML